MRTKAAWFLEAFESRKTETLRIMMAIVAALHASHRLSFRERAIPIQVISLNTNTKGRKRVSRVAR